MGGVFWLSLVACSSRGLELGWERSFLATDSLRSRWLGGVLWLATAPQGWWPAGACADYDKVGAPGGALPRATGRQARPP